MLRSRFFVFFAAVAVVAAACAPAAGAPTWTYTPGGANGAVASPVPSQGGTATGDILGTLDVKAIDLGFEPKELSVAKAGTYDVKLTNAGALPHNITFADGKTGAANAGETTTVRVTVPDSGLSFICSIPGHADAGMKGSITVAGSTAGSGGADDHGGPAPATDVQPDPNAPPYTLYPAAAPALLAGDVHDIDLEIKEMPMTVAYDPTAKSGFVQAVWTFNGTVPGPVIRVKVGDTIRIHLKNPATNQLAHSVDFHASQVAWNDEMTSINPGEEKLYEWHGRLRRRLDVPLRHVTGPPPHRQRHVRHGHRRAEGRPPAGRCGVRDRPERVVPRAAGPARLA